MFSIKPGRGAARERVLVKRAVRANSREPRQTARDGTKAALVTTGLFGDGGKVLSTMETRKKHPAAMWIALTRSWL